MIENNVTTPELTEVSETRAPEPVFTLKKKTLKIVAYSTAAAATVAGVFLMTKNAYQDDEDVEDTTVEYELEPVADPTSPEED